MYIKRNYGFWMTFNWSKQPFLCGLVYSALVTMLYLYVDKTFGVELVLSWQPLGVFGIAVAFYLGFKNNSSYDRTWEARKIWGAITNNSRSFAAQLMAYMQGAQKEIYVREVLYRHIAWLTALRYQLRLAKEWEHTEDRVKGLYNPTICVAYFTQLDKEMINFISEEEFQHYKSKSNMATQILARQSARLQELRDAGYFEDFRHMELQKMIHGFYENQGQSERIKSFPFPRQYASVALWVTTIFCVLLPFGMLEVIAGKPWFNMLISIPVTAMIIWIFFLMEKIGDYSENPFEGTYNDVPITSIARNIEIDIREMINDREVPKPIEPINGFLM
ncbi:MAG: hypothetical protein IPN29_05525 [Saprospiraceae bacterium]|nr:hypothetical protein [Saprospiraceae bacterium]